MMNARFSREKSADPMIVSEDWDEEFPNLANLTMMDCTEDRASLFTTSGSGFCFDYLCPATSATPTTTATAGANDPATTPTIPIKKESRKRNIKEIQKQDLYHVHEEYREEGQKELQEEFLASFRKGDERVPSAITTLESLFQHFPTLCFLQKHGEDFDLCFVREELMDELKKAMETEQFPKIVFTSFERGLKHAGMEVTQSTHGRIPVKKWRMKTGFVRVAPKPKKVKKRKDSEDFLPLKKRQNTAGILGQ